MPQSNYNDKDFFDLLDRPEGVVPKNFEATPPDATRSDISYIPPRTKLNLGRGGLIGSPKKASISKSPIFKSDEEIQDFAMGFVSPGVASINTVQGGARAASKILLPMVKKGNFDVFKAQKLTKDASLMPEIGNKGGISRIIEGSKNKIIETVYPVQAGSSYGNKHNYQLRPKDYYGSKRSENIAEIKFNMSDQTTLSGKPYKLMTDIATFTPKGTNLDYARLMSILLKRTKHDWAIKEDDASLDALYGMTKSWIRKALDVEVLKTGPQKFWVPSTRFMGSSWIKNNSPFAKTIHAAQEEVRLNPNSSALDEAIEELAEKVNAEWMKSGKVSGSNNTLFQGRVLQGPQGEKAGILESPNFYLKTFKEKLGALFGMGSVEFDKHLDRDINGE